MRTNQRAVCMVAYTQYEIDARVRREGETLVQEGFQVTCLTPSNGQGRRTSEVGGVTLEELGVKKYTGKNLFYYTLSYLAFLCQASVAIALSWRRRGLDTVHIHNMPDFLILSALLPRLAGKSIVLDIHDSMPETFASKFKFSPRLAFRLLAFQERICSRLANRVICVNHPQRDALVSRGIPGEKIFISLNSPDHRIFLRRKPRIRQEDSFQLIYHGTMAQRLGVDLAIRATLLLKDKIPGLKLHLWGGGEDLHQFQILVRELGLQEIVHFRPEGFPLQDLPVHLSGMDLGIVGNRQTSATELMLPVKLLEYVALGIPVVAPRLRTIQHYFKKEMLSYFEPDNPESMAEEILELYRDPRRRVRQAQKAQHFLDSYGWKVQGPEFVALHSSLLKKDRAV